MPVAPTFTKVEMRCSMPKLASTLEAQFACAERLSSDILGRHGIMIVDHCSDQPPKYVAMATTATALSTRRGTVADKPMLSQRAHFAGLR